MILGKWLKEEDESMRMWMVNPLVLCNNHLLGEHVEHHMFIGTLNKGISIAGYIENNLLEIQSLVKRHEALVHELIRRGYKHESPLLRNDFTIKHLRLNEYEYCIDRRAALDALTSRCARCYENAMRLYNKNMDMLDAFYKSELSIKDWFIS